MVSQEDQDYVLRDSYPLVVSGLFIGRMIRMGCRGF
jgi:hypothetical protein